jgi:hypothetical protein
LFVFYLNLKSIFMKIKSKFSIILSIVFSFISVWLQAQNEKPAVSAEELAKKLSNPVAALISVPFQNNTDVGIGQYNGSRNTLNFQPVIPISLSPKLNLITRYIVPIISQRDITGDGTSQNGLGDAVVSAWFSPSEAKNGLVWGVGPVFLVPIATNDFFASKKFGVGPTALVLKQFNGWTVGGLVNQIWSVAGDANKNDINQMFIQPFMSYNWKSGAGLGLSSEITQNWTSSSTTAYLIPSITAVTKLGPQIVSLGIGPRLQIAGPNGVISDFGVRASVTFVFPK